MTVEGNGGGGPNYFPNSFNGPAKDASAAWHQDQLGFGTSATDGSKNNNNGGQHVNVNVARYETGDEDNFSQCGHFFRQVLNEGERERLTDNISGHLAGAQEFIRQRAIANFAAADATYGQMVATKVAAAVAAAAAASSGGVNESRPAALSPPRKVPSSL
jgi:catalase